LDENQIKQAITCCAEFLCGECPYQKYEDPNHIMYCIHKLIVDVDKMINKDKRLGK
jgi:hypothetical protein